MTAPRCPHGLNPATCEICRVLDPTPVVAGPRRSPRRRPGGRGLPSVATVVVVVIVGILVVGWVAAAVFALLRILELIAIAAVAGWVGFRLGVRQGRRGSR